MDKDESRQCDASNQNNQNQNNAERKIQDVKRRTIMTLRYGKAPLVFWCFCMYFIVDCLNHSAQKELGYRTSIEKMFGHTPDISIFRFHFWEPVRYYKPTAKDPKSNFLPGRFVGIAWDHDDAFTYKIWTTPDDDWKKGQELIRNVVKSRSKDKIEPRAGYNESSLLLTKTKTTQNQQRRSQRKSIKRKNQDDTEPEEQEARKRLVSFSDSPQIHDEDPEEKGGKEQEQGTSPKPPTQNNPTSKAQSSTINSKRKQDEDEQSFNDFDPLVDEEIEMHQEVNKEFSGQSATQSGIGGVHVKCIVGHNWIEGRLKLKVEWSSEQSSWEELRNMNEDYPKLTA
jgi:hypothetical protein